MWFRRVVHIVTRAAIVFATVGRSASRQRQRTFACCKTSTSNSRACFQTKHEKFSEMLTLLTLLLGAATADGSLDSRHPEAVEVYLCDFGQSSDINHDRWPDHWKRHRSPDYPAFIDIAIADEGCLEVEMNGGAAMIHSPPIPISPLFSYVLEANVRTSELRHSGASISVSYFDADAKLVDLAGRSRVVTGTEPWSRLRVGPFSTSHERATFVVITLHVEPRDQGFDLTGFAQFDDVWLARLPRMTLQSSSPHNVYSDPGDVEITCNVSGIQQRDPLLRFELIDLTGRTLAEMKHRLDGEVVALSNQVSSDPMLAESEGVKHIDDGYRGEMSWRPPLSGHGFFRVRVRMLGDTGVMHEREISLVVVRPQPPPVGGEFGWSMPEGDRQLPLDAIADVLPQVGANWVKFPLWYEPTDRQRADDLAHFTERLNTNRI